MNIKYDEKQNQTAKCFAYKWARREAYESKTVKQKTYNWLVHRYFGTERTRNNFLSNNRGKKILDAGCGSGYTASVLFGKHLNNMQYLGVDISDSIIIARKRFHELGIKGDFIKYSINTMKLSKKYDVILCEGVLHHTSNPFKALKNLVSHLNKKGIIMFYTYKKKAPVREFVDDFIREKLKPLNDKEAWEKLIPLTKLGKTIGDLNVYIKLNEGIELLGIPRGQYNLQRFLYWFFAKMYYDKNYSLHEMNHVNFDWYRPLNCYRFSPDEINDWLKALKLRKKRFIAEESGITVVATKC